PPSFRRRPPPRLPWLVPWPVRLRCTRRTRVRSCRSSIDIDIDTRAAPIAPMATPTATGVTVAAAASAATTAQQAHIRAGQSATGDATDAPAVRLPERV